jgi:alpha-mannosidase
LIISNTSKLSQNIYLTLLSKNLKFETFVDWNEKHKFLKVEFPTDIKSTYATYEIQFGHLQRPTNFNTSYLLINKKFRNGKI